MILLMNTILLPTMYKMRVKAKMEVRDKDMKKRTKELEIGKEAIYAMPFYGRYAPCGAARKFMVRVHGGASERRDEGRNDINTLLGGEKGIK